MLSRATAIQFHKQVGSGKTKPCLMTCENEIGGEVELVVKLVAGCELGGVQALIREALTGMLAADLGLPVPEPFAVQIERAFAETIPDGAVKQRALASLGWNFGSRKLPPGYGVLPSDMALARDSVPAAMEILAFDTFVANPDRRESNPNVLAHGPRIAVFDHEMAFSMRVFILWQEPWTPNSVHFSLHAGRDTRHVFLERLAAEPVDLERFAGAFEAIGDDRIAAYRSALPDEWLVHDDEVSFILEYIGRLRDNLGAAIAEFQRALSAAGGSVR